MQGEHQIIKEVYEAKTNAVKADEFIKAYIPFIRAEVSKFLKRACTEQDDENSIAMAAFYEAILGYERYRGAFLNYAATVIKNRLIDFARKEARHNTNISLYEPISNDNSQTLEDTIPDESDKIDELTRREATRAEIAELATVLARFELSFSDIAENSPKQKRTLKSCYKVITHAKQNPVILEELLRTKKLPLAEIIAGTGVDRKTLERHRKYIVAMLLVQTNGFEIIREHLSQVLNVKEEV